MDEKKDMGDNRARRRGKHNLNFEDLVVFFFLPAVAHWILNLTGCCYSSGFSADTRFCYFSCIWPVKATMKRQDTVLSWCV